jgi:hypothetical protein
MSGYQETLDQKIVHDKKETISATMQSKYRCNKRKRKLLNRQTTGKQMYQHAHRHIYQINRQLP